LKKEYLQDYQARERKEFELFRRKILSHELDPDDRYPSLQRLGIVHQPIVLAACRTYLFDKEKIWSQIPFAGTLLIPLSAYDKDHMLNGCGFEVNDIPELIRLAKEIGRVRFGLADPPEYFENMKHFEPIFKELEPPELLYMPYEASSTDLKIIRNFEEEFEALASVNFYNSWKEYLENKVFLHNQFGPIMQHRMDTFVRMKILDIEEVDNISNLMITEPEHADYLLAAYECLVEPIFDPLKASKNFSLSEIQHYDLNSLASTMPSSSQQSPDVRSFPVDIGRYIMKQITLNPSTYYGCIDVIQHYEQNELYKVFEALDRAIKAKKKDEVTKHISELNEIMNNVWKDADKVKLVREGIKDGISVAIGGVGGFASSLIGAEPTMVGLLASLGFNAIDRALSRVEMSIGDRLARLFNDQYLVNVYDFKQRHNLK
jgi:hypothetical protein